MKWNELFLKPWALPLVIACGAAVIVAGIWLVATTIGPMRMAELKARQAIEPTVLQWTAGPLKIIDIRTGTEINRIIIGPDNQMIAERLYLNWEGEQEIRRIGASNR